MKLIEVEGGTLEEKEQVFKLVESGARGPAGTISSIGTLPEKAVVIPADLAVIGDSEASFASKKSTWQQLIDSVLSVFILKTDLDNVTNDAQLKRSAGDFQAFTQKTTPDDGDSLIGEDSVDGENKKRITLTGLWLNLWQRVSKFITGTGQVVDKGSVNSGTTTFDASAGSSQKITITAPVTLADSGWETTREQAINLWITISGGPHTMTAIPGSWNDKDDLFTNMADGLHLIQLVTIDTGVEVEVLGGAR